MILVSLQASSPLCDLCPAWAGFYRENEWPINNEVEWATADVQQGRRRRRRRRLPPDNSKNYLMLQKKKSPADEWGKRASACVSLTPQTQLCDFSYNQHSKLAFFWPFTEKLAYRENVWKLGSSSAEVGATRTEFLIKTWHLLVVVALDSCQAAHARQVPSAVFNVVFRYTSEARPEGTSSDLMHSRDTHSPTHTCTGLCCWSHCAGVAGLSFSSLIMIFFFLSFLSHVFVMISDLALARELVLTRAAPIIDAEWKSSALHHSLPTWSDLCVIKKKLYCICCFYAFTCKLPSHALSYAGTG